MKIGIPFFYLEFIIRVIKKKKVRAILGFLGMMVAISLIVSMNVLIDSLAADSLKLATASVGEKDVIFELVPADNHDVFEWAFDFNITRQLGSSKTPVINPREWEGSTLTRDGVFNSWFNATELLEIYNNQPELLGVVPRLIIDSEFVRTSSNRSTPFPTTIIFIDSAREEELDIGHLTSLDGRNSLPSLGENEVYIFSSAARSLNVTKESSITIEVFPFSHEDAKNRSEILGLNGTTNFIISSIVKNQQKFDSGLSNALIMDYSTLPVVFRKYNITNEAIIANQVVGVFPDVAGVQGGDIYNYRDLDGMKRKTLEIGEKLSTLIPFDPIFPSEDQKFHLQFSLFFPRVQAILFIAEISTIARVLLDFIASIALVIGGVLIYSLQTVSVEERIRDFSIMRTVGGKQRQIWIMVAIEGLTIVILGSLGGIVLSLGLASFLIDRLGGGITLVVSEISVITGLIAGVSIGIISSFIPAYRATSTNIVKGLDPLRQSIPEAKFSRERGINLSLLAVGLVMTIASAIVVVAIPQVLFGGGFIWLAFLIFGLLLILLIGMDLISVSLLIPLMEFLFSLPLNIFRKTRKVKDIVVRSLRRNRRRTTATAVMFSLSFAFVFFVGVNLEIQAATAERDAIMGNGSDVVLESQQGGFFFFFFGGRDNYYFSEGFAHQIISSFLDQQSHRVDATTLQRYNRSISFTEVTPDLSYARSIIEIVGGNSLNVTKEYTANIQLGDASLFDTMSANVYGITPNFVDIIYDKISFTSGSIADIKTVAAGDNQSAIISTGLAKEFNLQRGDPFRLRINTFNATYDILDLTVKAIVNAAPGFSGFNTGTGFGASDVWVSKEKWSYLREIIRSEKAPLAPFGDIPIERIFFKIVDPELGPDPDFELELSIKLGEYLSVNFQDSEVSVTAEEVQEAKTSAASGQALFSSIMGLAVIISFFGLMSSMYSSVQESQFEIGVMKAMGLKNSDVRNYLIAESTILTLSSGACGAVIGYILAYTFEFQTASFSEAPIIFVVPWFLLNFLFITSIIVGILGAVIPGRVVVRKNPVEILRRA